MQWITIIKSSETPHGCNMTNAIPPTVTGSWYYSHPVAKVNGERPATVDPAVEQGWADIIDELLRFRNLQDDYDGEGSRAPGTFVSDSAIHLTQSLQANGETPPDIVVPGVNGTIYLEWHSPTQIREIEITSERIATERTIRKDQGTVESTQILLFR